MTDELRFGIFREVNERIAEITGTWEWEDKQGFLCECVRAECTQAIWLTRAQYEAIRSEPARFVMVSSHERAAEERVIERGEGFVVVEKLGQFQLVAAGRDDPRRGESQTGSVGTPA